MTAELKLRYYPDKTLRQECAEFEFPPEEQEQRAALVSSLKEAMLHYRGIGLAAVQMGLPVRLFIVDTAGADESPAIKAFFNPEIVKVSDEPVVMNEGCLSFPTVFYPIERPAQVTVRAHNVQGQPFEYQASGLVARAIQHEMDHLDGKLMVDFLTPLQRDVARRRVQKVLRRRLPQTGTRRRPAKRRPRR